MGSSLVKQVLFYYSRKGTSLSSLAYLAMAGSNVTCQAELNYLKEPWKTQIVRIVNDRNTDALNGKRPFEERVFARFDALDLALRDMDSRLHNVDSRLHNLDSRLQGLEVRADDTNSRLQVLEIRAYDTKPIWEQALKEIVDTRRELSRRLDRIEAIVLETRAELREVEDRVDKIEGKRT